MDFDYIPDTLKQQEKWVVWRTNTAPTSPVTNKRQGWQDSPGTFHQAKNFCTHKKDFRLGFLFSPDNDIFGIDLDSCRNPDTGTIEPWATAIIERFGSYSEVSQSKTGVKIIGIGNAGHRAVMIPNEPRYGKHEPQFEIFANSKYFALTGDVLNGFESLNECQGAIDWLNETYAETEPEKVQMNGGHKFTVTESPGSATEQVQQFNQRNSIAAILRQHGYEFDLKGRPVRPGKDTANGHSASITDNGECERVTFWSSKCEPFVQTVGKPAVTYDAWACHVLLNCGGDFSAAYAQEFGNGKVEVKEKPNLDFSELKDFQPFPVECLPELAQEFVRENSQAIDCDPSFVALPLLSAIGVCLGNAAWVQSTETFKQPPMLWTCLIGKSGTAKSPALRCVENLLVDFEAENRKEFDIESEKYKQELVTHKASLKKRKPGAFVSPPTEPQEKRIMTTNATLAKLGMMMAANPKGVLYHADELASWVGMFTKFAGAGETDMNDWLSFYDGSPMNQDRKSVDSPYVRHAFVGVAGGLQPGRMFDVFTKSAEVSGLTARVMFSYPPLRIRKLNTKQTEIKSIPRVKQVLRELLDLSTGAEQDRYLWDPEMIRLEPAAVSEFETYFNQLNRDAAGELEAMAAAIHKIAGSAARIALIMHAFANPQRIVSGSNIGVETMSRAITIGHWFCNEAYRLYEMANSGPADMLASIVIEVVRTRGAISVNKMRESSRKLRRETAEDVEKVCRQLVIDGRLASRQLHGGNLVEYHLPGELIFDV